MLRTNTGACQSSNSRRKAVEYLGDIETLRDSWRAFRNDGVVEP